MFPDSETFSADSRVILFTKDTATTEIYTLSYTTLFRSFAFNMFEKARGAMGEPRGERGTQDGGGRESSRDKPIVYRRYEDPDERSEEHTSELQSQSNLVCRLLLEKRITPAALAGGLLWK